MNWQRRNYRTRLREDSSWWKTNDSPTRSCKLDHPVQTEPQDGVNDDEELYNEATSCSNKTMPGIKDKIHQFGGGAKPEKLPKPMTKNKINTTFLTSPEKGISTFSPKQTPFSVRQNINNNNNKVTSNTKTDSIPKDHEDDSTEKKSQPKPETPPPDVNVTPKMLSIQQRLLLLDSSRSPNDKTSSVKRANFKKMSPYKIIMVTKDGMKKFEKLPKAISLTLDLTPIKPLKLKDSRVQEIIEEFKRAFDDFKNSNEELYDCVGNFMRPEEEYYDDCGNTVSRESQRVSQIPEYPEEEENKMASAGSTSLSGPSGGSTSSGSTPVVQTMATGEDNCEDMDEQVYAEVPADAEPSIEVEPISPKLIKEQEKDANEKRKNDEKERKKKEKKEKDDLKLEKDKLQKEQKELQKEQKELQKERKKFKMTGLEEKEADGAIVAKAKGGKLDLAVETGDHVEIIRMTDNPKGKFLVRNESGTVGYVESSNVTIKTPSIKQSMNLVNIYEDDENGLDTVYEELDVFQTDDQEMYDDCT